VGAGIEGVNSGGGRDVTTINRGFREPSYFVLASLLDGPLHGYGISKRAGVLSGGEVRLAPGTLYGALDRLAEAQLIEECGHETVSGRPRHYYRITEMGRTSLLLEAHRLATAAQAVLDRITVDLSGEVAVTSSGGPAVHPAGSEPGTQRRQLVGASSVNAVQPSASETVLRAVAPSRS